MSCLWIVQILHGLYLSVTKSLMGSLIRWLPTGLARVLAQRAQRI